MTVSSHSARRWLARTGLAAAAAGLSVGVAGCTGSPPLDLDPAVHSVALPAPVTAAGSVPAVVAPAPAAPSDEVAAPSDAGRNPFLPLHTADPVAVAPAPLAAAPVDPTPAAPGPVLTRVLHRGSRGDEVSLVQQALADHGARLAVDGIYGPRTAAAVTAFQRGRGLAADGVVGPLTWRVLGRPAAG